MTRATIQPDLYQAWRGPTLLVIDGHGAAGAVPTTGFYFREARHLSVLRLLVGGTPPVPCSAAETSPNEIEISLSYPPVLTRGGGGSGSGGERTSTGLLARGLDLDLRLRLRPASLEVTLRLNSRWEDVPELEIGWALAADFIGVLDSLDPGGRATPPVVAEALSDGVRFLADPAGPPLETRVVGGGADWRFDAGVLSAGVALARQETRELKLVVSAVDAAAPLGNEEEGSREALLADYIDRLPTIESPGEGPLAAITDAALRDLGSAALLDGPADEWLMPAAGFPLYPAAFGRDAATAAWQAAVFDHGEMVRATAAKLSRLQGVRSDPWRDEQPGRTIQQARTDPDARMGRTPFGRYYGDVASPFMFIISIGNAYAWSGERALVERHWEPMKRVLDWAVRDGDVDGDGYVEYVTRSGHGPRHQGWKDSDNAVVDEEGGRIQPPFASCEIQGYHLAALQLTAAMALATGRRREARSLWKRSIALKERFNTDFWIEEGGYVAFGLDAEKRPVRVPTSNAAQCIPTGIVSDEHLPRLVERIFAADLYSGWGIRTLPTTNPAYNPLDYHLGSVWPVENGSVLFGLRRYGFDERALELARALYDLARLWPRGRTPECVGGYARSERGHPGAYPHANPFQSWNQSVFPIIVQTILGARPVGALGLLAIDPVLPPWLPELTIRGWRIGRATVTIRFWRGDDGKSHHQVLSREGRLRIVRQPPVDSLSAGAGDRIRGLVAGLLPD